MHQQANVLSYPFGMQLERYLLVIAPGHDMIGATPFLCDNFPLGSTTSKVHVPQLPVSP